MVASLVLGMPLSFSTTYILTALMMVPAAVMLGVSVIAAHMFAMFFAVIGGITPPSGAAMFVAAGIARANPMMVGFAGTRLAVAGFVVPFMFVYNPAVLILGATPLQIILATITAAISLFAFGAAFEGWILGKASWFERVLLILGGLALIRPDPLTLTIGYSAIALPVIMQLLRRRTQKAAAKLAVTN